MVSGAVRHEIVKNLIQIEKTLISLLAKRKRLDKVKLNLKVEAIREIENEAEIKELNTRIESLTDQLGI